MTLFRLLTEGIRALENAGVPDAKLDAQQLLLAAFHLDLVHFLLNRMEKLEEDSRNQGAIELYRNMIRRRARRCPLQQILGRQSFMGMEFYVNSHVLIPRQDTETLVEQVLEDAGRIFGEDCPGKALLDLCTGSGCIAVSLAAKGLFDVVSATDISLEALKVARRNAESLLPEWKIVPEGIRREETSTEETKPEKSSTPEEFGDWKKCMEFLPGDLFCALPEGARKYDVIVSNPPYIPTAVIHTLEPEVRDHEPALALDGAEDGLAYYRRIGKDAGRYLKPGGMVYLEIGCEQGMAVKQIFEAEGYRQVCICKDLPGKDRVVKARWNG